MFYWLSSILLYYKKQKRLLKTREWSIIYSGFTNDLKPAEFARAWEKQQKNTRDSLYELCSVIGNVFRPAKTSSAHREW